MSFDPSLGRWMEEDPALYVNGPNLYQLEESNPVVGLDPLGLADQNTTQPAPQGGGDLLKPSGVPTTQPVAPAVEIISGKGNPFFIVKYHGKGIPTFQQQVFIQPDDGVTVPPSVVDHEKKEHGGKDPFGGYVGDNDCKTDPNNTTYGSTKNGGLPTQPRTMRDAPNFNIYPNTISPAQNILSRQLSLRMEQY